VAERKTQTRRPATRRSTGASRATPDALGRLSDTIEAAERALKDLRAGMSRGSREMLGDVERTLRDARRNLRRTSRRISKDLEEVQQAARGKGTTTTRRATSSRRATGRGSTGRPSSPKK
jgi:ABC-type transporter Mla subunit MlaD